MKVEVTEGMRAAAEAAFCSPATSKYQPNGDEPDFFTPTITEALSHPDCQRQLRDMVLAAVPKVWGVVANEEASREWVDGFNDCQSRTIANINALFGKETPNDHE